MTVTHLCMVRSLPARTPDLSLLFFQGSEEDLIRVEVLIRVTALRWEWKTLQATPSTGTSRLNDAGAAVLYCFSFSCQRILRAGYNRSNDSSQWCVFVCAGLGCGWGVALLFWSGMTGGQDVMLSVWAETCSLTNDVVTLRSVCIWLRLGCLLLKRCPDISWSHTDTHTLLYSWFRYTNAENIKY